MKRLIGAALIGLLGAASAWAVDTRLTLPPDLSPLKAKLVVAKDTYTLDPAQKGAEFRKKLREAPAQAGGIQIQQGQIQIQAVPVPAPVPVPGQRRAQGFRRIQVQPAPQDPKKTPPAEDNQKNTPGAKDVKGTPDKPGGAEKDPKGPQKEKEKEGDVKVEGNVQGVIVISDGQGNTIVRNLAPGEAKEEKKQEKKDTPPKGDKKDGKGKEEKEAKDKKEQPNVQGFKIQAQGGQIQIQGRIQIQGGVPGGPPQVQVFVLGGPQHPLPPEVDMELELHNTSGREMTLSVGGGRSQLDLKLDGPGAVTVDRGGAFHAEGQREVKLAAGAVHKIPVKRLQHGQHGRSASYWTEPGQYTLTATYKAQIKADSDKEKDRPIEVTAPPVKIKVVEGK